MATTKKNTEKMVKIYLQRDRQHTRPERVYFNGKGYSIPRGKEIEVPESVADVIKNSQLQKDRELDYILKEDE